MANTKNGTPIPFSGRRKHETCLGNYVVDHAASGNGCQLESQSFEKQYVDGGRENVFDGVCLKIDAKET